MTDSKQKAQFGHKVILEKNEDNLLIGMKDLYSLTAIEYVKYQEDIKNNLQKIANEEEKQIKLANEEEQEYAKKQQAIEGQKEYELKYSKQNFLIACNYVLIGSVFGWNKEDKNKIHTLIVDVLNGNIKVEQALESNEKIKDIFYSLILKGDDK